MLTSLPFIACPTRCKERLSGLWLGVFFIHSKCTTPSLSKKPTCWNLSVKAVLGQLVLTGLPSWKRTNLNGVHQGCRPQHVLLRLPPPKPVTLESRRNQSPTDRVRAQWSITPHVGVSHPLPPPLGARGDYTVAYINIYICMFFFSQTCNMHVSFRHWLFRWLLIDLSCLQLNIRFRVYSGLI